jgi:excisionase family DNA binding protein
MIMESTLAIGQAAKRLGITVKTLQRWEREGRLVPAARTASNRRRYTESQLRAALESHDAAGAPDQD